VESGLLRDEDWRPLEGEICRARAFTPIAGNVEGTEVKSFTRRLPYASIEIESPALVEPTTGFITHKLDFQHLWQAFNVRGVADDEEVIVGWNKKGLSRPYRWFSRAMPGLRLVWVCPKGAYELMTDPTFRPELSAIERHNAGAPLAEWIPDVYLR
jgi:hypothetical protein